MKTKPSVGDIVYWYSSGLLYTRTVAAIDGNYVIDTIGARHHFKDLQGRIVKKKRVCEECAKPKELFYVGHDGVVATGGRLWNNKEEVPSPWNFLSTLALVSTEENKK